MRAARIGRRDGEGARKTRPGRATRVNLRWGASGPDRQPAFRLAARGVAKHITAAPDCLDVVLAPGGLGELLAELADEDVDDLQLRLVHAAVEVVEEHLLGERRALPKREQFQHLVFLAGQVHRLAVDLDGLGVEVDRELAGGDHRLGVALGAAHDRVDARDQLLAVERLGHVVVGAEAEALQLVLGVVGAGENQDRRLDLGEPELAQHVVAVHVRKVEVEQDQVVVVELGEIDAFFAEIRRIHVQVRVLEHQLDALGCRRIVFDEKDAHGLLSVRTTGLRHPGNS